MKKFIGLIIGTIWVFLAFGAFRRALDGLRDGHTDLLVWWTVIAVLLAIASAGAFLGTWIHAWNDPEAEGH